MSSGSRVELQIDYDLPAGLLGDILDRVYIEHRNRCEAEHSLQDLKDLKEAERRSPAWPRRPA